ncbi:M13 family metallopeptidase [Aurantiacibacter suaedae]|uniref:M13 family metallopeptidase n=1 Tax=Aurantiacibacter suaedae TaxID=2545755 RepID=UPI0010F4734F|nr:M13 family metallopeptidase [Aurantiacibacter suaedae]
MIRRLLASSVSALGLALAMPALAQDAPEAPPEMDFGTWGVDTSEIDTAAKPGDNFFDYANGKWVRETEIPSDQSRYGLFAMLAEKSTYDVQTLMRDLVAAEPAPGTPERRIVDAYNAYADTAAIDAAGLAPAQPYLAKIADAPDLSALVALFEEPGIPALVSAGVDVDSENPDRYLVSVDFNGMGLPDRDYYLVDSEENLAIRAKYKDFLRFMLGQAGYEDPATAAEAVYAFEHKVAELEWDRRMLRIPELTYNPLDREALLALDPEFPMASLLAAGQFDDQNLFDASQLPPTPEEIAALDLSSDQQAMMGGGLPAMMKLLRETPLATLKAYMAVRFLSSNAPVLPQAIDDANFDFYGTTLSGQQEQRPRWKRAIAAVEGQLGEQLGALYVQREFPPEAKAGMEQLVTNLIAAYRESISENHWMTPETTEEALTKLAGFTPMVGYPDEFETYDGLEIEADDPLGNRIRTIAWDQQDDLSKLGGPVDKSEWGMLPQTVNAYYSPNFNQIVFPAAILQQPFFGLEADPAVNYGAIGAVIGHEIGHGFDDQGSRFDATGALRNWWQDADRTAFEERTAMLRKLIEQYCPLDDGSLCLRGDLAMGETIGDVVGLQIAYRAYQISLDGEEAPVIDGLTGDQRFFLGFAQVWRGKTREARLRNMMVADPHPPEQFRLNNAVRQMDAWYKAFNVQPDDALYLAPEDRVSIW